jgi:hypothetical protein
MNAHVFLIFERIFFLCPLIAESANIVENVQYRRIFSEKTISAILDLFMYKIWFTNQTILSKPKWYVNLFRSENPVFVNFHQ